MSKTEKYEAPEPVSILQALENAGAFAAKEVHRDTIELAPGVDAEFYVRELPDTEFRKIWEGGDRAKLIAACICDADGKAVMTTKKAGELKPTIAAEFQRIALIHSGFGDTEKHQEEAGNG